MRMMKLDKTDSMPTSSGVGKTRNGQAMTEFAIVFPVMMLLFLMVIQTALLMTAKLFVNYAAYCAARSAIVYHADDEKRADKTKMAATIACIPISPMITSDISAELLSYGWEFINFNFNSHGLVDTDPLLSERPDLAGFLVMLNEVPGLSIIQNFREALQNGGLQQNLLDGYVDLAAGIAMIAVFCGRSDIPQRYLASAVLTNVSLTEDGGDVTAEVMFHYPMRVPLVNKVFFYMYLHSSFMADVEEWSRSNGSEALPPWFVHEVRDRAYNALNALSDASESLPLYLLPIRASCTLTVEAASTKPDS